MNPQQILMVLGQSIQIINDNIYRMSELANYLNKQAAELQKQLQELAQQQKQEQPQPPKPTDEVVEPNK